MPREIELTSASAEDTLRIARCLGKVADEGDTILLIGGLGAGKTQFTKGLADGLGVSSPVISPTFGISIRYDEGRVPLVHFDLYRLEDAADLEDVDFYASVDETSGCVCVVEWADMFPDEMPDDVLSVRLDAHAAAGAACGFGVSDASDASDWFGTPDAASATGTTSLVGRTIRVEASGERSAQLQSKWACALGLQ